MVLLVLDNNEDMKQRQSTVTEQEKQLRTSLAFSTELKKFWTGYL